MLMSQLIRTVAITGRTDTYDAWFAGRQRGRWNQQVRSAFPDAAARTDRARGIVATRAPADSAAALRELEQLHARGVVSEQELKRLRARLRI